jgi:crotonobetainyl-CoA:carnitine CoA-transferase CaiB-like acyl-CoA transferase
MGETIGETPAGETPYLEGVRVLDLTQYLAGPSCTRLLAELGADVIKVEMAPYGDPTRAGQPRRDRRSGGFVQQNRGKRSLCVDLRRPEGVALVKELVPHVDVLVENYSAGVMERRGLGYEALSAINPRLIMASVSGFGQTGPLRHKTSFDFIAQAYSGVMHMTGDPEGPPTFVGVGVGDTNAGVHAFAGIGYALYRRDRTGRGAHIDISMVDALFHMQETAVHATSMTGGDFVPLRQGRHYQPLSPAGTFKAPEGWVVILCTHGQIGYLWAAMGRPELAEDPRFATNDARLAHRDELTAIIEAWMAGFDTDAEVVAALEAHRVPCGPVLSPADALEHPYFRERGMVRDVTDPHAGTFAIPGFPIKFSDAPPEADLQAPALGQHNDDVLAELLGYDDATIAALRDDGVLFAKDR